MGTKLLSIEEVSEQLGVTRSVLASMRYMGNGPTFVKVGGRQVRYAESDVEAWIEAQKRTRT